MVRVAVVGLGKMGLSHLALLRAHPGVDVVGICDSSSYVLSVLRKYTGLAAYDDFDAMLAAAELDAVVIATPTGSHAPLVRKSLARGLHVFCEKPLTLSPQESAELTALANRAHLVTQVGYHHRFIGSFREVRSLLDADAIGRVTSARGEAYGPVVLKSRGATWRSRRDDGGGCLHDYAAHAIDLLSWYLGGPVGVGGTALNKLFSRDTEDEVAGTLYFTGGQTAQVTANWSDDSQRKMTTQVHIWGTAGRIFADRQECRVYLRNESPALPGYRKGWNVRFTTELSEPVWFYLRGEEYSAQLDYFVQRAQGRPLPVLNDFGSASSTDRVIAMMIADHEGGESSSRQVSLGSAGVGLDERESAAGRVRAFTRPISKRLTHLASRRSRMAQHDGEALR